MKIEKGHYALVKSTIEDGLSKMPKGTLQTHIKSLPKVGDINMRLRWDIYNLIPYEVCSKVLYTYLNDNHIDTALKSIMKELDISA